MFTQKLLSRSEFREAVFARDDNKCVICKVGIQDSKLDAHHIIERRLFPDGGYYIDNGATLCDGKCHLAAEQTLIPIETIRDACGITKAILPPHLYSDVRYDKWGNIILENGTRLRGELFYDESVQKVIAPVLNDFTKYVKYPRTYHFPWSPGVTKDDRIQEIPFVEDTDVVITVKMDGENTTFYNDYIHARSLSYSPHESRDRIKAIWANIAYNIPEGWRVCGENLYAKHSIGYENLSGYFQVFSIWNEKNECLPWDETVEWANLLELPMVPVLARIKWFEKAGKDFAEAVVRHGGEGIVVRTADGFPYGKFRYHVAKYVRQNHVQTHGHWMRQMIVPNKLGNI